GTAPAPAPRRTGKGVDLASRSPHPRSPPDPPATPAAANERGFLYDAAISGREAEFRRRCTRHRSRPIGGRAGAKAQRLELRLLIQFCACCPPYVSERTEVSVLRRTPIIAISQRSEWGMFHYMQLEPGTVAKNTGRIPL